MKTSIFIAWLTLLTALTISGVAIYYSVSGLAAIFSAAVIPIIIMGGVLEVSKLVTAVWLHRYQSVFLDSCLKHMILHQAMQQKPLQL
jgi:cytochrome b subunit of formate dehydrogenase